MRRLYKNFIRTLLLSLVFSAVFPFVYPWQDGKPLLSLNQLKLPALPELPWSKADQAGQPVTVYKWQDAEGDWQFGNEPPQGIAYESLELDPDTNLLAAVEAAPSARPVTTEGKPPVQTGTDERVYGYTPGKIEAMMEKTRQVRDSMNAHHQRLEGLDQ